MQGRQENKFKIENKIKDQIQNYPLYIKGYYASMNSKSHTSKNVYVGYILKFLNMVSKDINNIKMDDINIYLNNLSTEQNSTYRTTVWFALTSFFKYLKDSGNIDENPIENIPRPIPKSKDEVKRVFLDPEELGFYINSVELGVGSPKAKAFQANWYERDVAMVVVLIFTGMRCTALTELNINDIDFDEHTITVIDKRNKTIEHFLTDTVEIYLKEWLIRRNEILNGKSCDALFISNQKTRITYRSANRIVEKYASNIKDKNITPHKFRGSYATNLYKATGDVHMVQESMNHRNISTTQLYIKVDNSSKKKATNIMGDLIRL